VVERVNHPQHGQLLINREKIDYRKSPVPPLPDEDQPWAESLLRQFPDASN